MKLQSCLASLGAAAALAFASAGQAAVVSIMRNPAPAQPPGAIVSIAAHEGPGAAPATGFHPLVEDPSWTEPTSFAASSAEPPGFMVAQVLSSGDHGSVPAHPAGARPGKWPVQAPSIQASPFYSYLVSAGQYVLEIGTLSSSYTAPPQASTVPLPGAIWLFGSGLVAFLVISGRRKL